MKIFFSLVTTLSLTLGSSNLFASPSAQEKIEEYSNIVKSGRFACEEQFAILFGNGIGNDASDAKLSISELQEQLAKPIKKARLEKKTAYNNVYNPTHSGGLADAIESLVQKLGSNIGVINRWLSNIDTLPDDVQALLEIAYKYE